MGVGLFLKIDNILDFIVHNTIAVKVPVHVGNLFTSSPIERGFLWTMDTSIGADRVCEIVTHGGKLFGGEYIVRRHRRSRHIGIISVNNTTFQF